MKRFESIARHLALFILVMQTLHFVNGSVNNFFENSPKAKFDYNKNGVIASSNFRDPNRRIWIITTACLPWLTGTSVNPLLRSAYLANDRSPGKVTLMVPWLSKDDQALVFPMGIRFNNPKEQEAYVRKWLVDDAHLSYASKNLDIRFYFGRYHDEYHSIFPMGDITALIPDDEADVCIMEEPEHLNWYRAPFTSKAWMDKFNHVVGIIHTNYLSYTKSHVGGAYKEPLLYLINKGMCRAYCHKIIKLSAALQDFASEKEVVCNVHGVRTKYLELGDKCPPNSFTKGAYFIGKLSWPKGLREIFDLLTFVHHRTGKCFDMDIYGHGPHEQEIKVFAKKEQLPVTFHGALDHAKLGKYKVFVNPSTSEVLCTTIVEAIAMGKWVVCARHPSNAFFEQFPNCLQFETSEEFAANVNWALTHDPLPLTVGQRYALTWEAATERLITASLLTKEMLGKSKTSVDRFCLWIHELFGSGSHGDFVRALAGGKSVSKQIEYVKAIGTNGADPFELESAKDPIN